MDKQLFLDIDGCLADWLKAALTLHNIRCPDYTKGEWPYKRGPEGWYFYREEGMSSQQLFEGQADRAFWRDFEWTPDGKALLAVCERFFDGNIALLTAPYDGDGVADGRKDWVKHNMPTYINRTFIGKDKECIARGNPNAILIDDWEENINSWVRAGGTGILLPRPYNSNEYLMSGINSAQWVEGTLTEIFEGHSTS